MKGVQPVIQNATIPVRTGIFHGAGADAAVSQPLGKQAERTRDASGHDDSPRIRSNASAPREPTRQCRAQRQHSLRIGISELA